MLNKTLLLAACSLMALPAMARTLNCNGTHSVLSFDSAPGATSVTTINSMSVDGQATDIDYMLYLDHAPRNSSAYSITTKSDDLYCIIDLPNTLPATPIQTVLTCNKPAGSQNQTNEAVTCLLDPSDKNSHEISGVSVRLGQPAMCESVANPSPSEAAANADAEATKLCASENLVATRISEYTYEMQPATGCRWVGPQYHTPERTLYASATYLCKAAQTPL